MDISYYSYIMNLRDNLLQGPDGYIVLKLYKDCKGKIGCKGLEGYNILKDFTTVTYIRAVREQSTLGA